MTTMTLAIHPTRPTTAIERYILTAREAACPRDQVANFMRAEAVLQPRQLQASAAARLCDVPGGPTEVGMGGARGGGKSHWAMLQAGADDCQRYAGLKFLYLRQIGKKAREAFDDLVPRLYRRLPHKYNRTTGDVTFSNGSRIVLGHFRSESDIDQYLGIEYDGAIIEEATQLSKGKVDTVRGSIRTSKTGWRPRIYFTTNPGGIGHQWFKKQFVDQHRQGKAIKPLSLQTGETRFIPSTIDDNRFVNVDYRKTLDRLTGWLLRAWRFGDWDIAAGQYFSTFRRESHIVAPFQIPLNWSVWGSLDYGYTHYTVFHLHAKDNDGGVWTLGEHAMRKALVSTHAAAIRSLADRCVGSWNRVSFVVAGADVFGKRGSERTIADQYADEGIQLDRANDDRVSGATTMLGALGDYDRGVMAKWRIFDRCAMLIEQLPAMQHDPHRPEDVLKVDVDEDGEGGDDAYDCARYGVMAAGRVGAGFTLNPNRQLAQPRRR